MTKLNAWENTTPKDEFNTFVCSKLFPYFCLNVDKGSSSTTLSFLKTPYLVGIKDILKFIIILYVSLSRFFSISCTMKKI